MNRLKILNKKEVKPLVNFINSRFEADFDPDMMFLESGKKKIYMANKDVATLPFEEFRINQIGLYFAERVKDEFRLSFDGAMFIGKTAKRNVLELSQQEVKWWMSGVDFNKKSEYGFHIIKFEDKFLGCAKSDGNKIFNYVPKIRRLNL